MLSATSVETGTLELGNWFANAASSFAEESPELDSAKQWIAQLNSEAVELAVDVAGARSLLWTTGNQFQVLRGLGLPGLILVSGQLPVAEAESLLATNPLVQSFELNRAVGAELVPNDPQFVDGSLPGLENDGTLGTADADIDATAAWDITTGDSSLVVGVIDSGVALDHPDLYRNIWLHQGEIPSALRAQLQDTNGDLLITLEDLNHATNSAFVTDSNGNGYVDAYDLLDDPNWADGIDNEGNGFVDDLFGWDFVGGGANPQFAGDNDPSDEHGHGTHVAGTLAASGDNGIGVTGIAWSTSIMPLRFLDENRAGQLSDAIASINYATLMRSQFGVNMPITNNSWGYRGAESQLLRIALEANAAADMLFVAAAGNGDALGFGIDNDRDTQFAFYPASDDLDHIVSVAATNARDQLARFSNFGATRVDLAAPGVGVLSTDPLAQGNGGYTIRSGTSMAAPLVSGVAALVWAANPDATAAEVKAALLDAAATDPLAELADRTFTGGRLNALGALSVDRIAPRSQLVELPNVDGPGVSSLTFTVTYTDNSQVELTSIDGDELSVIDTFDGSPLSSITLLNTVVSQEGKQVEATYRVNAPAETFDNGDYEVVLNANSVFDIHANAAVSALLGAFNADTTPNLLRVESLSDDDSPQSLRSLIQQANAAPEENTIRLAAHTYRLSLAGADEDLAAAGDLDITGRLTIKGAGADRTIIDAAALDRVFHIGAGAEVELRDLSITGGSAALGGGLRVAEGGTLVLRRVMIYDNQAQQGGGVYNAGTIELFQSTIQGNQAVEVGGGLVNISTAAALLENTTVSNNSASGDNPAPSGGGISNSGSLTLRNSTIAENHAQGSGGGVETSSGVVTAVNSMIAGNMATLGGHDLQGAVASLGHNLVQDSLGSSGWLASDLLNVDPLLGPLQINGGNVETPGLLTHALRSNSPAIDAADNAEAAAIDQRGISRTFDGMADIGAVERYFGSVQGTRFLDENENGIREQGEVGLAGLAVYVDLNQNEQFDSGEPLTFTEADGTYQITGLAPASYSVVDIPQQGWRQIRSDYGTTLELVSQGSQLLQANGRSDSPAISGDGRYIAFSSAASNLVPNDDNFAHDVFVYDRVAERLEIISVNGAGLPGNGDSDNPTISADGRVVVFESRATNLDPLAIDTNSSLDVYAYDRTTSGMELISSGSRVTIDSVLYSADMSSDPTWQLDEGADQWEYGTPQSTASGPSSGFTGDNVIGFNLAGDYANNLPVRYATTPEINVAGHDNLVLQFQRWLRIEPSGFDQAGIELSLDGGTWTTVWQHAGGSLLDTAWEQVGYQLPVQEATSIRLRWYLGPTDSAVSFGGWYLDDVQIGTVASEVTKIAADGHSANPSISADGRLVAFDSSATNLVVSDTNQAADVFVRDRQTGAFELVSVTSNGTQANFHSEQPAISGDGNVVVFVSYAQNLDSTGIDIDSSGDIYTHNRTTGTTELVSVGIEQDTTIETLLYTADMTTDPGWILEGGAGGWEYGVPQGVGDDPTAGFDGPGVIGLNLAGSYAASTPRMFATTGEIDVAGHANLVLQFHRWLNIEAANFDQAGIEVSADGGPWTQVWNHTGETLRESTWQQVSYLLPLEGANTIRIRWYLGATNESQSFGGWNIDNVMVGSAVATPIRVEANNSSFAPTINHDGRYVAFVSFATNLVFNDFNNASDAFVYDRTTETTERVSLHESGMPINGGSFSPTISGDARYVVFEAGEGFSPVQVYLHDRQEQRSRLVSQNEFDLPGDSTSFAPVISADGNMIAFSSLATTLIAEDTNNQADIYFVERQSGVVRGVITTTESVPANGASAGVESTGSVENSSLSYDGRYIAFSSLASNLVSSDTNQQSDIFVQDRLTNTIEIISLDLAGNPTNGGSFNPVISSDGRFVAFESLAANLVAADLNGSRDVFLFDRLLQTMQLVSRSPAGEQANGDSSRPAISGDGSVIVFDSLATNLDPLGVDFNASADVFAYDRLTGELDLVSRGVDSNAANGESVLAQISDDGRSIVFSSSASNLDPAIVDRNQIFDIYHYNRDTQVTTLISAAAEEALVLDTTLYSEDMSVDPGWTLEGGAGAWEYGQPQGNLEDPASGFTGSHVVGYNLAGGYSPDTPRTYATTGPINVAGHENLLLQFYRHLAVEQPLFAKAGIEVSADEGPWLGVWENKNFVADLTWQQVFYSLPVTGASSIRLRWYMEASADAFPLGGWNIDDVVVGSALSLPAAAQGFSSEPVISGNGRFIGYLSDALNIAGGNPQAFAQAIHLYDREAGITQRLESLSFVGLSYPVRGISLSAEGRYLAFATDLDNLVPSDINRQPDVFVYDRMTGGSELISSANNVLANGFSSNPVISGDGRYVAFRSEADNLTPADSNFLPDVFVAPTSVAGQAGIRVNIASGATVEDVDLGNKPGPGAIRGRVYQDENQDGTRQPQEGALLGWTVFLDTNQNGVLDPGEPTRLTNSFGEFEFANLIALQSYQLRAIGEPLWVQTTPRLTAGGTHEIVLGAGQLAENLNFGFDFRGLDGQSLDQISGAYFLDENRNGVRDAGESPLAGGLVYIDTNNNATLDPGEQNQTTAADGSYRFTGLPRGSYLVRLVGNPDLVRTQPLNNTLPPQSIADALEPTQGLAVGDFNNDSFDDVVVATGDGISLQLNNQAGGFLAPLRTLAGVGAAGAYTVVAATLNNDQFLDLAFTNRLTNNLTVMFGNGDGTFTHSANYNIGTWPHGLTTGDFDRDGLVDLAVGTEAAGSTQGTVAILWNNSEQTGTFSDPQVIHSTASTNAFYLEAVQLTDDNLDGLINTDDALDLVVANFNQLGPNNQIVQGNVTVLYNGASGFSTSINLPAGDGPAAVATGDFDRDGDTDLAVANFASDSVSIYHNLGNGSLVRLPDEVAAGSGPFAVTSADVDNDGDIDLIVSGSGVSRLLVLRNITGDDRVLAFSPAETYGSGVFPQSVSSSVATADFNRDGLPDLVISYNEDAAQIENRTGHVEVYTNSVFPGGYEVVLNGLNPSPPLEFGVASASTGEVIGRHVFYNHSVWDGNNLAANAADDLAIASNKHPLLPGGGQATFANYTSYSRGINGLMIDLVGQPPGVVLDPALDFSFQVGNDHDPDSWQPLLQLPAVSIRRGAGESGSDRVTLTWPDQTIVGSWLRVTVHATARTGLAEADVFYFGNAPGETGNSEQNAAVDGSDFLAVRANPKLDLAETTLDNPHDVNRDGLVDTTDTMLVRQHATRLATTLRLINVSSQVAIAEGESPSDAAAELLSKVTSEIIFDPIPQPHAESPLKRSSSAKLFESDHDLSTEAEESLDQLMASWAASNASGWQLDRQQMQVSGNTSDVEEESWDGLLETGLSRHASDVYHDFFAIPIDR